MALTYPLSVTTLADLLKIASVTWSLFRNDQVSGIGTGQVIGAELTSPLWTADVQTDALPNADARKVKALINSLAGPINSFYLYDPVGKYPANDPTGTILAASTPTIDSLNVNNKALVIAGLPIGFVLSAGDYFHFDYGSPSRRALHECAETVTVLGTGKTPEFEVSTFFRTGVVTGLSLTLLKPAAKVFIMPNTLKVSSVSMVTSRISFTVMQKL